MPIPEGVRRTRESSCHRLEVPPRLTIQLGSVPVVIDAKRRAARTPLTKKKMPKQRIGSMFHGSSYLRRGKAEPLAELTPLVSTAQQQQPITAAMELFLRYICGLIPPELNGDHTQMLDREGE